MHDHADPAPAAPAAPDRLLGGRLALFQPPRGHRAGTDAVLLIAAAGKARHVVDLGSGVGTAGLGLGVLGRAERMTLVEREPDFAALALQNIVANGLSERARVIACDIADKPTALAEAGLAAASADLVIANPPFNQPGRHRASPDGKRAAAHEMEPEDFDAWTRLAAHLLDGRGRFAIIHRPEAMVWLLPMLARRFGALTILPVHGAAEGPANRVLIGGQRNSKAPARLLPGLALRGGDGGFTALAAALHAGEATLDLFD